MKKTIKYTCKGEVCGGCDRTHRSVVTAQRCCDDHHSRIVRANGCHAYSDRQPCRVDGAALDDDELELLDAYFEGAVD